MFTGLDFIFLSRRGPVFLLVYITICKIVITKKDSNTEFGGSSLTNEKDHHYFLNRFVCVGEFFDG